MSISDRISKLHDHIAKCCARYGRDAAELKLMAVSKTADWTGISQAYGAGIRLFGENRVQHAARKFAGGLPGVSLHMIGHLQRNKASKAAALFDCVQSVDRYETALAVSRRAEEGGVDVMLELRTGEDSKHGYASESLLSEDLARVAELPRIRVTGLMTMAPFTDDTTQIAKAFSRLARLFADLQPSYPHLRCLSMGMSRDYEIAIAEGSTMIRVGSAIFNEEAA